MPDGKVMKEFEELDSESAPVVIQPSSGRFGRVLCGDCSRPLWPQLEAMLRFELDGPTRTKEEKEEFERGIREAETLDEETARKKKVIILLAFLNKGRDHETLLKCPGCKKILLCDF